MRLSIKKEFFDKIKDGSKCIEFRDAHITFVCNETKEELKRNVESVMVVSRKFLDPEIRHLFTDKRVIAFKLNRWENEYKQ